MCVYQLKIVLSGLAAILLAVPAYGQSLPTGLVGVWDVSVDACTTEGTSVTQMDIASGRIDTFGGNAIIRDVERTGNVTFASGDFEQLEGAAEVAPRERVYFRFDQGADPDRMRFVWKDVQSADLFRCDIGSSADSGVTAVAR